MPRIIYIAGWNMPGYMPEAEPATFAELDDAREYLVRGIDQHDDDADDGQTDGPTWRDARFLAENLQPGERVTFRGLAYWIQTDHVQTAAERLAAAFFTDQRADGSSFVRLPDNAPEWMRDAVREAHDGAMPHDWIYSACCNAAGALAELDDDDDAGDAAHEWADMQADVYRGRLASWLSDVEGAWDAVDTFVSDYQRDGEMPDTLDRALMGGQYVMLRQIFMTLAEACEEEDEA